MERKSKLPLYLAIIVFLLLTILGCIYYYMLKFSAISLDALDEASRSIEINIKKEALIAKSELQAKEEQIKRLESQNLALQKEQNIVPKLHYSIKPKEKLIAHCVDMKMGKWNIPTHCMNELSKNAFEILKQDGRIVAFEVSGIVDNHPYAGRSPELKQEGLASFRAREVIHFVNEQMPDVVAFEGLSKQEAEQRGFVVRAYYVE